jgi:hypothetical protein
MGQLSVFRIDSNKPRIAAWWQWREKRLDCEEVHFPALGMGQIRSRLLNKRPSKGG